MKKRFNFGNIYKIIPLFIIIGLSILFRFYNLPKWIMYGMDQENESLIIQNIVRGIHFPSIGLSIGDTGLYRGPGVLYLYAIIFKLFSGDPIIGAVFASGLGVITTFLVYFFGKRMFSNRIGLFSSLFYATSFLMSFYERQFWNPTLIPLFSLLIGFLSFKILKGNVHLLPYLAVLFGFATHSHFSILIFIPLLLYLVWHKRKLISRKLLIICLLLLVCTQAPLIIFEFRHNFQNAHSFINLFSVKKDNTIVHSSLSERFTILGTSVGRFISVPSRTDLFVESGQCTDLGKYRRLPYPEIYILCFAGFVFFIKRTGTMTRDSKISLKIIAILFITTFVFFIFYNRNIFEYYLLYLFPWIAIVFGIGTDYIWKKSHGKIIVIPILILIVSLNLLTLFTAYFSFSYEDKMSAIKYAKKFTLHMPYALEAIGGCARYGGYRYLFEYFSDIPKSSYMDSYFGWLYRDKINDLGKENVILLDMIDPREDPLKVSQLQEEKYDYLAHYFIQKVEDFGNIRVYILSPIL